MHNPLFAAGRVARVPHDKRQGSVFYLSFFVVNRGADMLTKPCPARWIGKTVVAIGQRMQLYALVKWSVVWGGPMFVEALRGAVFQAEQNGNGHCT